MAVKISPDADNQALLATTLHNLGRDSFARGDLASALEKATNAIAHWQGSAKASGTNGLLLSLNNVAKIYELLGTTLFEIGMQSFTNGDFRLALERFTNAANALVEFQKSYGWRWHPVSKNNVARMFSYAAEANQRLGDSAQAYEFSKRAFEADGSAFHQAQMAGQLMNLGR